MPEKMPHYVITIMYGREMYQGLQTSMTRSSCNDIFNQTGLKLKKRQILMTNVYKTESAQNIFWTIAYSILNVHLNSYIQYE